MMRITVLLKKKSQLRVFYAEIINYIWNKMCELPLTFQGLYLLITEPWQIEIIYKLGWNGNPILFLVLLNNSIKEFFIHNMYAIFSTWNSTMMLHLKSETGYFDVGSVCSALD